MASSFPALIAESLKTEKFKLLDIGCSGGLDPVWRAFEPRLQALGIDASVTECKRLAELERNPDVAYVAAFAARSADKPIDISAGPAAPLIMKMRDRMSFMRTREIRDARLKQASTEEQLRHNAWEMTGLADPAKPVVLPDLLAERGWGDLDYIKLDVDGADFDILQSFAGRFDPLQAIAVQLEVNFVGTDRSDEHTFHNTDRFMRAHGFDLFRLDVRNFSVRALPARYIWPTPAETVSGRPFQGEAYYARDLLAPHRAGAGTALSIAKLAKLAHQLSARLGDDHDLAVLRQRVTSSRSLSRPSIRSMVAAIDHRRRTLQRKAHRLGQRLYRERPRAFEKRLGTYWRAWRRA